MQKVLLVFLCFFVNPDWVLVAIKNAENVNRKMTIVDDKKNEMFKNNTPTKNKQTL